MALNELVKQNRCGSTLVAIIKIEKVTKLELTFGEELGTLCSFRFPDLRINNEEEYLLRLEKIREYNREGNYRRKK